ncbi:MAG: triose-phosphate isomerase [Atribacterota bacterium]|nr:triose-phosphate isomerase [Atribacterota bacterium]
MSRKPLIVGNWKMNKTVTESISLIREIIDFLKNEQNTEIAICPPFTSLWVARELIQDTNILLGAQNMYFKDEGAYTGEVSAKMLQNIGCRFVILGHSERRMYFKENSQEIADKAKQAIKFDLTPIICVGENLEERDSNQAEYIIQEQIKSVFEIFKMQDIEKVIFAYEPIWAIGTGKSATPEEANGMIKFIRELVREKYAEKTSEKIKILYGGSVNPDNISELMLKSDIDGALVGGASLNALTFSHLFNYN